MRSHLDLLFADLVDKAVASEEVQRGLRETTSISAELLRERCLRTRTDLSWTLSSDLRMFEEVASLAERVAARKRSYRLYWWLVTSWKAQLALLVTALLSIFLGFAGRLGADGFKVNDGVLTVALILTYLALVCAAVKGVDFTGLPRSRAPILRIIAKLNPYLVLAASVPSFYLAVAQLVRGDQAKNMYDHADMLAGGSAMVGLPMLVVLIGSRQRRRTRLDTIGVSLLILEVAGAPTLLTLVDTMDSAAIRTAVPDLLHFFLSLVLASLSALATLAGIRKQPASEILSTREHLRAHLAETLSEGHIMPFLRAEIAKHADDYSVLIDVRDAPGVSQVFDTLYRVPTASAARVRTLLDGMPGGSIGLAGSRGSGKTTLMESCCSDGFDVEGLATIVAAPVEYSAREFLLHLHAKVCFAVLGDGHDVLQRLDRAAAIRRFHVQLQLAGVLTLLGYVLLVELIPKNIPAAQWWGIASLGSSFVLLIVSMTSMRTARTRWAPDPPLTTRAAERLEEIRFQQSFTATTTGTVKLPIGIEGALSRARGLTRQPMHLPEIVDSLRGFLTAAVEARGRVVIGIDELDKMKSEAAAEQFLNEIKGVFGIRGVYFLVSVSEQAMSTFERRGLPFRDVFDSTFDEIVWFDHFDTEEAIATIDRRVLMPIPFKQLCFTLSGGLPRDLIRVVRTMLEHQDKKLPTGLSPMTARLVTDDVRRKARAVAVAARRLDAEPYVSHFLLHCDRAASMAISPGQLRQLMTDIVPDCSAAPEADLRQLYQLVGELVCFFYYSATILEFFEGHAPTSRWRVARTAAGDDRALSGLVAARQAFTSSPFVAWQGVSRFRVAWGMDAFAFPTKLIDHH